MSEKIKVTQASWHRNGLSGVGFYAVLFEHQPNDKPEQFFAALFDEPGYCAVISLDRVAAQGVGFARGNSWRGDYYESELREAIARGDGEIGQRDGPFSILDGEGLANALIGILSGLSKDKEE